MNIPTTPILILRFPDGDVEHRTTRGELPIGTLLRTRGALWRVRSTTGKRRSSRKPNRNRVPPGVPLITADLIGDTPLTFEILTEA